MNFILLAKMYIFAFVILLWNFSILFFRALCYFNFIFYVYKTSSKIKQNYNMT